MFRIEHNVETGEIKKITMTAAEIKEREEEIAANLAAIAAQEKAAAQEAADKAALLAKLGISEDEAKLLLS